MKNQAKVISKKLHFPHALLNYYIEIVYCLHKALDGSKGKVKLK